MGAVRVRGSGGAVRGKRKPVPQLVARADCPECRGEGLVMKYRRPGLTYTLCKCVRESDGSVA